MLKYIVNGFRLACLWWVGAVALLSASAALVCEVPEYDFGKVPDSEVITHAFTLHNDGDQLVNILGVSASCGCTTSSATTNSLEAGSSTEIVARVSLRGRSGIQRFPLRVRTDDPDQKLILLMVSGTVLRDPVDISQEPVSDDEAHELILARPAVISLSANAVDAVRRIVIVYSPSETPFSIVSLEAPPGVQVSIRTISPHRHDLILEGLRPSPEIENSPLQIHTSRGDSASVAFRLIEATTASGN